MFFHCVKKNKQIIIIVHTYATQLFITTVIEALNQNPSTWGHKPVYVCAGLKPG